MTVFAAAAHAAPAPTAASTIQAQLDAEIAEAKADAAEALAEAQADGQAGTLLGMPRTAGAGQGAAVAPATGKAAQVVDAGGRTVTIGPDGIVVQRGDRTVTVMADADRSPPADSRSDGPSWIVLPIVIVLLVLMFRAFQHWTAVQAGYPIRWGSRTVERGTGAETARALELLAGENEALRSQVSRLEERVAVLERIATDPARRVAAEIEALR
jgi:hypothetical protein